jgi:hypothetical protein
MRWGLERGSFFCLPSPQAMPDKSGALLARRRSRGRGGVVASFATYILSSRESGGTTKPNAAETTARFGLEAQ